MRVVIRDGVVSVEVVGAADVVATGGDVVLVDDDGDNVVGEAGEVVSGDKSDACITINWPM